MDKERRRELEGRLFSRLTYDEIEKGYHFCPDWDYMLIGPNDPEKESCLCVNSIDKHRSDSDV